MSAYSITTRGLPQGTLTPMGALLFAASEPGAWYDPSDISTLFQDEAGTTPVTAVEQPVGRMLDKSGRGNHATQATTTKRPVYSRRVNLFLDTSTPDASGWIGTNASLVAGRVTPNAVNGQHYIYQAAVAPGSAVMRFTARADGYPRIMAREGSQTGNFVCFDLVTGSVVSSQTYTGAIQPSATDPGGFDCTVYLSGKTNTPEALAFVVGNDATNSWGSAAFAGDGVKGVIVKNIHLTLAIDAHLPYQWVTTAADYDADPAKFPAYLRFDGVDDALQTGNINFTSTDKMTGWAGVTKLSDAAEGVVAETSLNSTGVNPGSFALIAPLSASASLRYVSQGTLIRPVDYSNSSVAAPKSVVMTGRGDIGGDVVELRVNSAVVGTNTYDGGTGNYGNYPLYIGARAGTANFFNGRLYSLIVRGAQTPLSQIEATELYIKQKMRMP